jgi:hypothetical protein
VGVCPCCSEELLDYEALASPGLLELVLSLGRSSLEVLRRSFGELLAPQPALVMRSGEAEAPPAVLLEQVGRGARLRVSARWQQGARVGLMVTLERAGAARPLRALLQRSGRPLEGLSDASGKLAFAPIAHGQYELQIRELGGGPLAFEAILRLELVEPGGAEP